MYNETASSLKERIKNLNDSVPHCVYIITDLQCVSMKKVVRVFNACQEYTLRNSGPHLCDHLTLLPLEAESL